MYIEKNNNNKEFEYFFFVFMMILISKCLVLIQYNCIILKGRSKIVLRKLYYGYERFTVFVTSYNSYTPTVRLSIYCVWKWTNWFSYSTVLYLRTQQNKCDNNVREGYEAFRSHFNLSF